MGKKDRKDQEYVKLSARILLQVIKEYERIDAISILKDEKKTLSILILYL